MSFLKGLVWPLALSGCGNTNNQNKSYSYECSAPVTAGYSAPLRAHSVGSDHVNPDERKKLIIKENRHGQGLFIAEIQVMNPETGQWGPDGFLVNSKPAPLCQIILAADTVFADASFPIKNEYLGLKSDLMQDGLLQKEYKGGLPSPNFAA